MKLYGEGIGQKIEAESSLDQEAEKVLKTLAHEKSQWNCAS